jgi:hypothetical protein
MAYFLELVFDMEFLGKVTPVRIPGGRIKLSKVLPVEIDWI